MPLHDLLTLAARRHGSRTALRLGPDSLTYEELDRASSQLAALLAADGIERPRVAILCPKSFEAVIGIYGALKAGCAYVPVDAFAPEVMIGRILSDCGITHLVCADAVTGKLEKVLQSPDVGVRSVYGAELPGSPSVRSLAWRDIRAGDDSGPFPAVEANDLAYILYTSGSTGTPKGIMHTQASAVAFVDWVRETIDPQPDDRLSSHAPFHFDLSTLDLFAAAAAGATTVLIPEPVSRVPASLSKLIEEERISIWYSVPFALMQLLERGGLRKRDTTSLRWVLFAGEQMPMEAVRELPEAVPQARLANLYGPTETNVCSWYEVTAAGIAGLERLPIGAACAGTTLAIIDPDGGQVPRGACGELVVSGPTVMAGYWNRASEPPFISVPGHEGRLFYRTGDLVRETTDGMLVFHGRADRQVKVRGYRIELDAIEAALNAHQAVLESAVFVGAGEAGTPVIEAAAVLREGATGTPQALVAHLRSLVPAYATPARLTILNALPRTSTGKIDRKALSSRPPTSQAAAAN